VLLGGKSMLSQFVVKFVSLSVAFTDNPSDGVFDAQWGMLRVTGSWNSSPTGPHITSGDNIFSPEKESKIEVN
jgi:hypothetical protein